MYLKVKADEARNMIDNATRCHVTVQVNACTTATVGISAAVAHSICAKAEAADEVVFTSYLSDKDLLIGK